MQAAEGKHGMVASEGEQHSGRFAIIPSVALDDPGVTPTLLRLLCVLGTYGDKHGYCRVKLTTIGARMGGVGKPAISNGLRKLKELGYLEITPRFSHDVGQLANQYRILFDVPTNNGAETNGGSPLDVNGESPLDVNGESPLDVNPLNVPYERKELTTYAAAISIPPHEELNGGVPDAAAAAWSDNLLTQTAEQIRQRLHMPSNKLPGLQDVLRQYPPTHAPRLIAQAASCEERLKVRPLGITHYANFLVETDNRAAVARQKEANNNGKSNPTSEPPTTSLEDRRLAAQRDREKRGAANRKVLELFFPEAAK